MVMGMEWAQKDARRALGALMLTHELNKRPCKSCGDKE